MGLFTDTIKRTQNGLPKKEDDLTGYIKDFFEHQRHVQSYTIVEGYPNWVVDVEGDIHVQPDNVCSDGTFGFKLGKVTGSLICHCKSISHDLLPTNLGGSIVFDIESMMPGVPKSTQPAAVSDEDKDEISDGFAGIEYLNNTSLSKEGVRGVVLTALFEAEYQKKRFGVDYNLDDILKEFNTQKDKKYCLEIELKKVVIEGPSEKKEQKCVDCHIYITDENDEKKELKMKAQEKAVYLLFTLFENGISIKDFPKENKTLPQRDPLLNLYIKLHDQLKDHNSISDPKLLQSDITSIRSRIRNRITAIIPNKELVESFAIEGYKEQPFKVAAATQEQRELIIEMFHIDRDKYGL